MKNILKTQESNYNPFLSEIKDLINTYYVEKKPFNLRKELHNLAVKKERNSKYPIY